MPVEIRELIVKASIRNDRNVQEGGDAVQNISDAKDEIIRESSEKILQILKNKKER